jgi:hypothetical protein
MRNVYAFAGLTLALALAFTLTTAAQTSSTESKQQASPDQNRAGSAGNRHRDRVGERLKWLSQHLNLTEDQKKQLKPILAGELKTNESGGRRRITDSISKARKDGANPRGFAPAGSGHPYARTAAEIRSDEGRSQRATRRHEGQRAERLPTTTVVPTVLALREKLGFRPHFGAPGRYQTGQ